MRYRIALASPFLALLLTTSIFAQSGASTSFTFDANGNLTSRTESAVTWSYIYDSRDLLLEIQRNGVLHESYQYDYQGHRIRKTTANGIVRYVWDGDRIVLETDDFGNTIARYQYAGDRLLSVHHATEGTAFFILDGLGSPVALSRPDGSLAARYRLDAWGVLRYEVGSFSNPFRFTGHLFDEATGLYYAKARYYDPELGRFLSEDPLDGSLFDPPSLHPYLYARANPTVFTDSDGRRAATEQDRAELRQILVTETRLKREYAESGTYQGRPIRAEEYDHALVDLRIRQQSYVQAVMEAHEGERVAPHLEQAGFYDRRGVMRYRPVPSRERWERDTQENARELFLYIEGPNMVASVLAGVAAPAVMGRPSNASRMLGQATEQSRTLSKTEVTVRESGRGLAGELVPGDAPLGFRTRPLQPDVSYSVDEGTGLTTRAEGVVTGPHSGRGKGYRPEPAGGRLPGDHRGHLIPEGGVQDPALVNVRENIIAESPQSNLRAKKQFDNLVSRIAAENPSSAVRVVAEVQRAPGESRPHAVTYWIEKDGARVYGQTIFNPTPVAASQQ